MKRTNLPYIPAIILSILTAACSDAPQIPAEELYVRSFVKEFGVPAKSHTWSMASPVEAKISLGGHTNGTATFYTDAPGAPGCAILAQSTVSGGRSSARFDIPQGTEHVYAKITLSDGTAAGRGPAHTETGTTRRGETASRAGPCPVTAAPLEYKVKRLADENLEAMKPYVTEHSKTWEDIQAEHNIPPFQKVEVSVPRLYALNNFDYSRRTPEFTNLDIIPVIFSYINDEGEQKAGLFNNPSDYNFNDHDDNVTYYFFKNKILDPDVTFSVRETGRVDLDLMWRTPQSEMYWGYYYYKPEDEAALYADPKRFFEEVPKYVMFRRNSVDPEHGMSGDNGMLQFKYCEKWSMHPNLYNPSQNHDGEHEWTDWQNLTSDLCKTLANNIGKFRPSIMRSTRISLVYFGEDGEGESSYEFPAGTRIGFFYGSVQEDEKFYFGKSAMNYYLFHHKNYTMSGYPIDQIAPNYRGIYAAKFRFNGSTYIGFELGDGDNDLNDMVFRIHNTWPPEQDLTPDDLPKPEPKEWILACEDLGNNDDYDFNDVVLKLSHVDGTDELNVTPLACGGVLNSYVYFGGRGIEHMWGEIHDLLGVPRGAMAGVGLGYQDIDFSKVETRTFKVPENWLASESFSDFTIFTENEGATHVNEGVWIEAISAPGGEHELSAPQMLLLPAEWRWPIERRHITHAYPMFTGWVGKPGENSGWTTGTEGEHHRYSRIDR